MHQRFSFISLFIFVFMGSPWAHAQDTNDTKQRGSFKLGVVASMSGAAAIQGESIHKGIELAVRDLKSSGAAVDVVYEDDGTIPPKTVSAFMSLMTRGYSVFIGLSWSYLLEASTPTLERSGAITIASAISSDVVASTSPAVFFGTAKVSQKFDAVVQWLKTEKIKKVAIVYGNCQWGEEHRALFAKAAQAAGAELLAVESFDYGDETGAIPIIINKLRALNVDALLTTSSKEGVARMARVMGDLHMSAKLLSTEDAVDALQAKLIPENNTVPIYALWPAIQPEFRRRFEQAFGQPPYAHADSAYDSVMLLYQAHQHTDGSPAAIRQYLENIKDYQGLSGRWTFDAKHDVTRGDNVVERLQQR